MNPFRTGKLVLFQVTYNRDWHFFEIIFFVILGIFGVRMWPFSNYILFHQVARRSRDFTVHLLSSSTCR